MLRDKYVTVKTANRDWALILRGLSKKIKGASILQLTPLVSFTDRLEGLSQSDSSPETGSEPKSVIRRIPDKSSSLEGESFLSNSYPI